jgi:hypothetical protein
LPSSPLFRRHPEHSEGSLYFAVAVVVCPFGYHPRRGSAVSVAVAFLGCHPRRGSAVAVAVAFLVVIPEGDLLLQLPFLLSSPQGICGCSCFCICRGFIELIAEQNIAISTEAVHSRIVNSAVERPPYFAKHCQAP